jgi:Peroxidase, family 2
MANHGYLPRSGKGITFTQIAKALIECYGLYTFFAYFLAYGTIVLIHQWGPLCLADIGRHGGVEHDASLAHKDTPPGEVYAPDEIDEQALEHSMGWMTEEGDGFIDAEDVARARVHRERLSKPLDSTHAEIARGEMAIALLLFAPKGGPSGTAPADYMREWIGSERLPLGGTWKPVRKVGLFATMKTSREMKNAMAAFRKQAGSSMDGGSLYVEPRANRDLVLPTETGPVIVKVPKSYGTLKPANGHQRNVTGDSRSSSSSSANDDLFSTGMAHERHDTASTEVDAEEAAKPGHK